METLSRIYTIEINKPISITYVFDSYIAATKAKFKRISECFKPRYEKYIYHIKSLKSVIFSLCGVRASIIGECQSLVWQYTIQPMTVIFFKYFIIVFYMRLIMIYSTSKRYMVTCINWEFISQYVPLLDYPLQKYSRSWQSTVAWYSWYLTIIDLRIEQYSILQYSTFYWI